MDTEGTLTLTLMAAAKCGPLGYVSSKRRRHLSPMFFTQPAEASSSWWTRLLQPITFSSPEPRPNDWEFANSLNLASPWRYCARMRNWTMT